MEREFCVGDSGRKSGRGGCGGGDSPCGCHEAEGAGTGGGGGGVEFWESAPTYRPGHCCSLSRGQTAELTGQWADRLTAGAELVLPGYGTS